MQVVWLDNAIRDLQHIYAYIQEYNPIASKEIAQKIITSVEMLGDFPYMSRQGIVPDTREFMITGTKYYAVISLARERVQILNILHEAQDWK